MILWDFKFQTFVVQPTRHSGSLQAQKTAGVIDVSISVDSNIGKEEHGEKDQGLKEQLEHT